MDALGLVVDEVLVGKVVGKVVEVYSSCVVEYLDAVHLSFDRFGLRRNLLIFQTS